MIIIKCFLPDLMVLTKTIIMQYVKSGKCMAIVHYTTAIRCIIEFTTPIMTCSLTIMRQTFGGQPRNICARSTAPTLTWLACQ